MSNALIGWDDRKLLPGLIDEFAVLLRSSVLLKQCISRCPVISMNPLIMLSLLRFCLVALVLNSALTNILMPAES